MHIRNGIDRKSSWMWMWMWLWMRFIRRRSSFNAGCGFQFRAGVVVAFVVTAGWEHVLHLRGCGMCGAGMRDAQGWPVTRGSRFRLLGQMLG